MYFNRSLFLKAQRLALLNQPATARRWAYVLGFSALFGAMREAITLGQWLDRFLSPGFRDVSVRQPVFIIAPPRSGTTLLQNLMSLDTERFVHSKMYQTIFPSVTWQRLLEGFAAADRRCGAPLARAVDLAQRRWFGAWDDLHRMRLDQPEEDDGYFVYTFVTEAIYLLFPFVDELWEAGFADALPEKERRPLMQYYRGCLQRLLFANGKGKTVLAKATQLSGAVNGLLEEFPDARIVTIVRHPYESVPSHVSLFYPAWHAHSPEISKDSPVSKAYARLALEWYRHLYEARAKIPPEQFHVVRFSDLVADPAETVAALYRHFGFEMTGAMRGRLDEFAGRQRSFHSTHRYTLEEFGLSREWIQAEIGDVLDGWCLPR